MKNKKLFAILTLVCFMFTLMPVAAFADADPYVWVEDGEEVVKLTRDTNGDIVPGTVKLYQSNAGKAFYLFAMKDGKVTDKMAWGNNGGPFITAGVQEYNTLSFAEEGEYTVYAVAKEAYEQSIVEKAFPAGEAKAELSATAAAQELIAKSDNLFVMENNVITVKEAKNSYDIKVLTAVNEEGNIAVGANSGFDKIPVKVKLTNYGKEVANATLKLSTNSYALTLSSTEVKTNAVGEAKFYVSASTAGEYNVYVEYGTKADKMITIDAGALAPAVIKTVAQPTAPDALYDAVAACGIVFNVTDANGNAIERSLTADEARTTIVEKPADSTLKATDFSGLTYNPAKGIFVLGTAETFDAEGTYTFKVTLNNGAYAVGTVTVKEFQTPVALKLAYEQTAVELDGEAILDEVVFVDANGVEKDAKIGVDVELSATGYAIDEFYAKDATIVVGKEVVKDKDGKETSKDITKEVAAGTVVVEDNEKYVGSTIKVVAVSEKYNLVDTVTLTVANEAAAVKYASTKADVAVNNTLVANIVDVDGNKVALNAADATAKVQYIVLNKPADSKVAISTIGTVDPTTGQFKVSFTASAVGDYEVQTVVRYNQTNGVVKYYSGIETITVGNTGINDVVVMSINSNEIVKNGEVTVIDAAPIVENNRTFVPFRALAQAFGAEVAYDEATQAVTAELNGTTVVLTIGSAEYTVNGVAKTADVAPFIAGSRTMVPVRFVAQAFGITVTPTYDDNGATADILFAK